MGEGAREDGAAKLSEASRGGCQASGGVRSWGCCRPSRLFLHPNCSPRPSRTAVSGNLLASSVARQTGACEERPGGGAADPRGLVEPGQSERGPLSARGPSPPRTSGLPHPEAKAAPLPSPSPAGLGVGLVDKKGAMNNLTGSGEASEAAFRTQRPEPPHRVV